MLKGPYNRRTIPGTKFTWLLFGIFVLVQLFGGGITMGLALQLGTTAQSWVNLGLYTVSMVAVLALGLAMARNGGYQISVWFKFKWPKVPELLLLLGVSVSFVFVIEPLLSLMPVPDWIEEMFASLIKPDLPTYLMVAISAPLLEELLFRGFLLRAYLKKYPIGLSLLYSSFFFGLFHLNPWQFAAGLIIGILAGWLYLRSQSVLPPIILHFVNNSFSFWGTTVNGNVSDSLTTAFFDERLRVFVFPLALIVFVGCFYLLNKNYNRRQATMV